jgi:hypothetical protein
MKKIYCLFARCLILLTACWGFDENCYGYKENDLAIGQIWIYNHSNNPFADETTTIEYKILDLQRNKDDRLWVKHENTQTSDIGSHSAYWFLIDAYLKEEGGRTP